MCSTFCSRPIFSVCPFTRRLLVQEVFLQLGVELNVRPCPHSDQNCPSFVGQSGVGGGGVGGGRGTHVKHFRCHRPFTALEGRAKALILSVKSSVKMQTSLKIGTQVPKNKYFVRQEDESRYKEIKKLYACCGSSD